MAGEGGEVVEAFDAERDHEALERGAIAVDNREPTAGLRWMGQRVEQATYRPAVLVRELLQLALALLATLAVRARHRHRHRHRRWTRVHNRAPQYDEHDHREHEPPHESPERQKRR